MRFRFRHLALPQENIAAGQLDIVIIRRERQRLVYCPSRRCKITFGRLGGGKPSQKVGVIRVLAQQLAQNGKGVVNRAVAQGILRGSFLFLNRLRLCL